jgi:hypothetical protein
VKGAGGLGQVLDRLADYLEKADQFRRKVGSALIYPGVLAVMAVLVVIFLLAFIVPRISEQLTSMGHGAAAAHRNDDRPVRFHGGLLADSDRGRSPSSPCWRCWRCAANLCAGGWMAPCCACP